MALEDSREADDIRQAAGASDAVGELSPDELHAFACVQLVEERFTLANLTALHEGEYIREFSSTVAKPKRRPRKPKTGEQKTDAPKLQPLRSTTLAAEFRHVLNTWVMEQLVPAMETAADRRALHEANIYVLGWSFMTFAVDISAARYGELVATDEEAGPIYRSTSPRSPVLSSDKLRKLASQERTCYSRRFQQTLGVFPALPSGILITSVSIGTALLIVTLSVALVRSFTHSTPVPPTPPQTPASVACEVGARGCHAEDEVCDEPGARFSRPLFCGCFDSQGEGRWLREGQCTNDERPLSGSATPCELKTPCLTPNATCHVKDPGRLQVRTCHEGTWTASSEYMDAVSSVAEYCSTERKCTTENERYYCTNASGAIEELYCDLALGTYRRHPLRPMPQ